MIKLQILGTGCPKCEKLAQAAEQAAKEVGTDYEVEKIKDINEIMNFGVMMTPALVINGQVKSVGNIPSIEEIKSYITADEGCCSDKDVCDIGCNPTSNDCDCGGCC